LYFPAAGKQAFSQGVGLILSKRGKLQDGIIHLGFKKNIDQSWLYLDYNTSRRSHWLFLCQDNSDKSTDQGGERSVLKRMLFMMDR